MNSETLVWRANNKLLDHLPHEAENLSVYWRKELFQWRTKLANSYRFFLIHLHKVNFTRGKIDLILLLENVHNIKTKYKYHFSK